ncbi:hypothetical protein FHS43_000085 [Streptosporangium becharense]|uniref:Uncharacterized protein n=1 Tax=Streptosporangium becharense TaxID=1816182 RepID=A0A7W9IGB4_9ACTN|nr:hypothetical protein [Streptosporangium becharense]MBB2908839.1 hypothetical protein [Streptosporangium becharense]MBB5820143.1 hypothetical protein [Streptosporangium becharense]
MAQGTGRTAVTLCRVILSEVLKLARVITSEPSTPAGGILPAGDRDCDPAQHHADPCDDEESRFAHIG